MMDAFFHVNVSFFSLNYLMLVIYINVTQHQYNLLNSIKYHVGSASVKNVLILNLAVFSVFSSDKSHIIRNLATEKKI